MDTSVDAMGKNYSPPYRYQTPQQGSGASDDIEKSKQNRISDEENREAVRRLDEALAELHPA